MKPWRLLVRVWTFLFRYERFRLLGCLSLVLTGVYAMAATWLSRDIVQSLATARDSYWIAGVPDAITLSLAYGVLTLLHGYWTAYAAMQLLGLKDRAEWRADELVMSKAAQSADVMAFEAVQSRDRVWLASMGGRAVATCFGSSIEVLQSLVTVAGLALVLARYHQLLILLILVPSVPLCLSQLAARSRMFAVLIGQSPQYRRLQYYVELMLGGDAAKEVRAYNSGVLLIKKYRAVAKDLLARARDQRRRDTGQALIWGCVAAAGVGSAYLFVVNLAQKGAITAGDMVMYTSAAFYLGTGIRALIQGVANLWTNLLAVDTFFSYLDSHVATPPKRALIGREGFAKRMVFRLNDVSFTYAGRSEEALDHVSFEIQDGETIAIVGFNGAGKSTLVKVMLGLLRPDAGTVAFRGQDLRAWDMEAFRGACGVVFQDCAKFKRLTLFENIALGLHDKSQVNERRGDVIRAAEASGVDEIANRSPLGYQTLLGREFAGGMELSGGEWQRVALARGLVENAGVLFLDEPSASLDPKTEQAFFDRILEIARGRTTIIVSHRLSVARLATRILVLENGRLIEQGSHQELMARAGSYARMYEAQARMYGTQVLAKC